ncbi:hypothetical protein F5Y09DRAFT_318665 [Xylaria sp. FL1042]|nr:hypothetical protein F5Y09DRAFT_318665 [Xylaria sp. FL1042]
MSTPTADEKAFLFNKLPPELRQDIWDRALLAESKNRIVLVDVPGRTIYPTKLLISLFLEVNCESRERAKRFYSYRLKVSEIHPKNWCRPGIVKPSIRSAFKVKACSFCPVGAVYLNTEHDTFCVGFVWPLGEYENGKRLTSKIGRIGFCGITEPRFKRLSRKVRKVCFIVSHSLLESLVVMPRYFRALGEERVFTNNDIPYGYVQWAVETCNVFPIGQYWSAIFLIFEVPEDFDPHHKRCHNITDILTMAEKGWDGQRHLMNMLDFKYAVARLAIGDDNAREISVHFIPLTEINK